MITREERLALTPGDRIVFKSPTRDGCRKANRIVTRIDEQCVYVTSYLSWSGFMVKNSEILEVMPQ